MLHLGTLASVLVYYRSDVAMMAKFDKPGRRLITLIVIGTAPAVIIGLLFEDKVEELISEPRTVAVMLIVTGVVLLATTLLRLGDRTMKDIQPRDSLLIGFAQALALIPGISRSGMTISSGLARGLERTEAARFAFLLGVPVIAGAGLLQIVDAIQLGEPIPSNIWVGVAVAGLSGYAAIAILLRLLTRVGLAPFGLYCITFGAIAIYIL
jgi:undecaprenyl-diphosphatase